MIAFAAVATTRSEMIEQHLHVARAIAFRLKRRYPWVDAEDLHSYSLLGLTVAAKSWEPDRGVPFGAFAARKAMCLAIDEMRHDRILHRESSRHPQEVFMGDVLAGDTQIAGYGYADPHGQDAMTRIDVRDQVRHLLMGLAIGDRCLVAMYYADGLTFTEIGDVLEISESAVCVRHAAVLKTLRRRLGIASQRDGREGGVS